MSGMSYSSCFAQNALESDCNSHSEPENIKVAVANLIVDPTKNTSLTILFDFKSIWYYQAIIWDDILDYYHRGPVLLAPGLGDCTYQEQFIFTVEFFRSFTWNMPVKGPRQGKLCECAVSVRLVFCISLMCNAIYYCASHWWREEFQDVLDSMRREEKLN